MANELENATLYFGYGSNLWRQQMKERCPTSKYLGIARLNKYRWLINDRGYANVVKVEQDKSNRETYEHEVWGLVYSLEENDERRLDANEGVPYAYTKEWLQVDFWASHHGKVPDTEDKPTQTKMLVYIDRKRVEPAKPKKEYIYRMNMGIKDAVKEGMPEKYVDNVMRPFIPDVEDKSVEKIAKKQALMFEDER